MNDLTEFQARALALSILRMFQSNYFDICTFDHALKMLNRQGCVQAKDYQALRALHCVHWNDMGKDMANQTQLMVLEALGMRHMVDEVKEKEQPQKLQKANILTFFKKS